MHPAPSIVAFTVLSGLGYGLAVFLGLGLLEPAAPATRIAHAAALALISAGLLSSTLHLGNPRRAWRAFSQWRSSWLSREGVLAVLAFVPLTLAAFASVFHGVAVPFTGLVGALLALCTVYCTSMIYASLKSVRAWATPLTPACYLLFSLAGGALLATFFAAAGIGPHRLPAAGALLLLAAAWACKLRWWRRQRALAPLSTPESATGLGGIGAVRLLEPPHMTENYLTREMGFQVARRHAAKLRALALGLGGAAPFALTLPAALPLTGSLGAALLALAASLCFVLGMLAERWLFFAEARHAVMNYYGG